MTTNFENIYDIYCPLLYSIALEISPNKRKAEQLLLATFQKFYRNNLMHGMEHNALCMCLIKIVIHTAKEISHKGTASPILKLRHFQHTPLLHRLLVDEMSIENFCEESNMTRHQVSLQIRQEFMIFRKSFNYNSEVAYIDPLAPASLN